MKIQKQMVRKSGDKTYYKYVLVLPPELVKEAKLREGQEINGRVENGKLILER